VTGENGGVAGAEGYDELVVECARLVAENAELRALVARLEARIDDLERRMGQNSGNSSLPLSRDDAETRAAAAAKRQSRRTKSGRRQGKQPGEPGTHLARVVDPDRRQRHVPPACRCCGAGVDLQRNRNARLAGSRRSERVLGAGSRSR